MRLEWIRRYFDEAYMYASYSKDPSSKVGALVVTPDGRRVAEGYNGFPRGVMDLPERYSDRETKYRFVVHAEANCVCNAACLGRSLAGTIIFNVGLPMCNECAKLVIQSGVKVVHTLVPRSVVEGQGSNRRWVDAMKITREMFYEAGVDFYVWVDEGSGGRSEPWLSTQGTKTHWHDS